MIENEIIESEGLKGDIIQIKYPCPFWLGGIVSIDNKGNVTSKEISENTYAFKAIIKEKQTMTKITDINGVEHEFADTDMWGVQFDDGADVIILKDGRRIGMPASECFFVRTEQRAKETKAKLTEYEYLWDELDRLNEVISSEKDLRGRYDRNLSRVNNQVSRKTRIIKVLAALSTGLLGALGWLLYQIFAA